MSGPFALRVDPGGVDEAAATLTRLGVALDRQAADMRGTTPGLEHAFRGRAAGAFGLETAHLSAQLTGAAPKVHDAVQALTLLATQYRQAVQTDVPALNEQWQQALDTHAAAIASSHQVLRAALASAPIVTGDGTDPLTRATLTGQATARDDRADAALTATQRRLRAQFDRLHAQLQADTTRASGALSAAVQLAVPAGAATSATPGTVPSWAWTEMAGTLPMTTLSHYVRSPTDPTDPAALKKLLDLARGAGLMPVQYRNVLQAYYLSLALQRAGIDWSTWNPALGAKALIATILKTYDYYGKLYLADPNLQWAGLANLIGPTLVAGFLDLHDFRELAKKILSAAPPGFPESPALKALANASDAEMKYFETTLLQMSKNIFVDQAPMHEAYLVGGLPAIKEMGAAGLLDPATVKAWEDIDAGAHGDAARLKAGTIALAYREQYKIIGADWDTMRHHDGPVGEGFTYLMTVIAAPSVPGSHSYAQVYPLTLTEKLPVLTDTIKHVPILDHMAPSVTVTTPFPAGNISVFDDRWKLILNDSYPAYENLIQHDPGGLARLIGTPTADRYDQYRLSHQWDDILLRMTKWKISVDP